MPATVINLMLPDILIIIQTAALLAIAALTIAGKLRGPIGPKGDKGDPGDPAPVVPASEAPKPAHVRTDLAEVFTKRGDQWHHHGWAQRDSEAYHDALKRRGFAVLRHNEADLDLGEQG